jgi:lipoate-protein ligase B
MRNNICEVHVLETISFEEAWILQEKIGAEVAAGERSPTLLILEHPHTYTFGRRGDPTNLLFSERELRERGIVVHWVDRGGDITYHGPGQLVGYPLIPLENITWDGRVPRVDYVGYIRKLETVLVRSLTQFGIESGQIEGLTGVWIQPGFAARSSDSPQPSPSKIASIGVKVDSHGITRHGFALNVDPDMSFWEGIIACGLTDHPQISIADLLNPPPEMDTVQQTIWEQFLDVFGYKVATIEESDGILPAT